MSRSKGFTLPPENGRKGQKQHKPGTQGSATEHPSERSRTMSEDAQSVSGTAVTSYREQLLSSRGAFTTGQLPGKEKNIGELLAYLRKKGGALSTETIHRLVPHEYAQRALLRETAQKQKEEKMAQRREAEARRLKVEYQKREEGWKTRGKEALQRVEEFQRKESSISVEETPPESNAMSTIDFQQKEPKQIYSSIGKKSKSKRSKSSCTKQSESPSDSLQNTTSLPGVVYRFASSGSRTVSHPSTSPISGQLEQNESRQPSRKIPRSKPRGTISADIEGNETQMEQDTSTDADRKNSTKLDGEESQGSRDGAEKHRRRRKARLRLHGKRSPPKYDETPSRTHIRKDTQHFLPDIVPPPVNSEDGLEHKEHRQPAKFTALAAAVRTGMILKTLFLPAIEDDQDHQETTSEESKPQPVIRNDRWVRPGKHSPLANLIARNKVLAAVRSTGLLSTEPSDLDEVRSYSISAPEKPDDGGIQSAIQRIMNERSKINKRWQVYVDNLHEHSHWEPEKKVHQKQRARASISIRGRSPLTAYKHKYGEIVKEILEEHSHFPNGFGFFVARRAEYSSYTEPELYKAYQAISHVQDKDTQDKLLCFLDDFKIKRNILNFFQPYEECKRRTAMIRDTLKSMVKMYEAEVFSFVDESFIRPCLQRERGFKDVYMKWVTQMERLTMINKQLSGLQTERKRMKMKHAFINRAWKNRQRATSVQVPCGLLSNITEVDHLCTLNHPMAEAVLDMVTEARHGAVAPAGSQKLKELERCLLQLAKDAIDKGFAIEDTTAKIKEKSTTLADTRRELSDMRKELVLLQVKQRSLESSLKRGMTDAETQTALHSLGQPLQPVHLTADTSNWSLGDGISDCSISGVFSSFRAQDFSDNRREKQRSMTEDSFTKVNEISGDSSSSDNAVLDQRSSWSSLTNEAETLSNHTTVAQVSGAELSSLDIQDPNFSDNRPMNMQDTSSVLSQVTSGSETSDHLTKQMEEDTSRSSDESPVTKYSVISQQEASKKPLGVKRLRKFTVLMSSTSLTLNEIQQKHKEVTELDSDDLKDMVKQFIEVALWQVEGLEETLLDIRDDARDKVCIIVLLKLENCLLHSYVLFTALVIHLYGIHCRT
jgi:hypothetical protein